MPIDDLILTWLSPEACPAGPVTVTDDKDCPSCGYVGEFVAGAGRPYCPACFGILPNPPTEGLRRIVHCPDCDCEIMIWDRDRNKTIICPRCKFFLGCIYRDEPGRQLEVFGLHLPSLLRHLPLIRSIRPDPTGGPRTVSIRVAGQALGHEDSIDASCEAWDRTD